jgi:hypothetical protein
MSMDRNTIEQDHIVARYLANQLEPHEAAAFEAHYTQNPEAVRDIERALSLKEGLAVLQDRGELDALIHERHRRWLAPVALAAALALVAIGVTLWRNSSPPSALVGMLAQVVHDGGPPIVVADTYVLARVRGPTQVLEIALPPRPGAIELKIIPSARTPNDEYRVTLALLDPTKGNTEAGAVEGLKTSNDGFVTAWLDTARLKPGRYEIALTAERTDPSETPPDRFVVEMR